MRRPGLDRFVKGGRVDRSLCVKLVRVSLNAEAGSLENRGDKVGREKERTEEVLEWEGVDRSVKVGCPGRVNPASQWVQEQVAVR
jgi:hypothetical protein